MRHIIRPLVILGAIAVPFGAGAADKRVPLTKVPPPVLAYNWTGCYLGGQAGALWSHFRGDVNYPGDGTHPAVIATRDFDGDGSFLYGGQIGCNWQQPGSHFVMGLEADMAGLSGGGFGGEVFRFGAPLTTDHFNATGHFANEGSLRLRAGYAVERMLFYIAGGWTRARLNATAFYFRDGDGSLTFDTSVSRDGWNVGFGGEYSLGNNWTMGLEYRFTDYGSITRNVPAGSAGTLSWSPFAVSVDNMHTSDVRLRLNYKFNRGFGTAPVITPFL